MTPSVAIPKDAVSFKLARLVDRKGRNKETGRNWHTPTQQRLHGDPTDDGVAAEEWPVAEFSVRHIGQRWGAGKYMVTWYGGGGERLSCKTFTIASAMGKASALKPKPSSVRDRDDDESPQDVRGRSIREPGDLSTFELITMLDERAERAAERARQDAQQRAESDRTFMAGLFQVMTHQTAAPGGGAAPSVDMGREMALLRREIAVTIQERFAGVQQQLAGLVDDGGGADDLPAPKDLGQAAEQVAMSLLREVTSSTPEIVQEILPTIFQALKSKGVTPSAQTMRQIRAFQAQAKATASAYPRPNGAPFAEPEADPEDEDPDDANAN